MIVAGVIGIPLLAIRTFAANRSANASLEQAKAANQSAAAALEQAKTAAARHEEQTKADRERWITESFAKAVEQLGSDKLETRLGGIYTLERIARESEREYWPIIETLTAFVREHAPWPSRQGPLQLGTHEVGALQVEYPPSLLMIKTFRGCGPCGAWGSAQRFHKSTGSHIREGYISGSVYQGAGKRLN